MKKVGRRPSTNRIALFFVTTVIVVLALYFVYSFETPLSIYLVDRMAQGAEGVVKLVELCLWAVLTYLFVRALNFIIFGLVDLKRGFETPTLVRNIFSIVAFTILFFLIFAHLYPDVNLGALFTTSAIFGVILGLALQDTLGNFFAGISLQADRPFQVGDVIMVGAEKHTGVVEEITWRAVIPVPTVLTVFAIKRPSAPA